MGWEGGLPAAIHPIWMQDSFQGICHRAAAGSACLQEQFKLKSSELLGGKSFLNYSHANLVLTPALVQGSDGKTNSSFAVTGFAVTHICHLSGEWHTRHRLLMIVIGFEPLNEDVKRTEITVFSKMMCKPCFHHCPPSLTVGQEQAGEAGNLPSLLWIGVF